MPFLKIKGCLVKFSLRIKGAFTEDLAAVVSLQGKRLPPHLSDDAEEGEVSDDDSADEIEDDFKLRNSNVSAKSEL